MIANPNPEPKGDRPKSARTLYEGAQEKVRIQLNRLGSELGKHDLSSLNDPDCLFFAGDLLWLLSELTDLVDAFAEGDEKGAI